MFEADGGDLDVSDEMEEIRELLYELIKSNFPSGVTVEHLAKTYKERYAFRLFFKSFCLISSKFFIHLFLFHGPYGLSLFGPESWSLHFYFIYAYREKIFACNMNSSKKAAKRLR